MDALQRPRRTASSSLARTDTRREDGNRAAEEQGLRREDDDGKKEWRGQVEAASAAGSAFPLLAGLTCVRLGSRCRERDARRERDVGAWPRPRLPCWF